MAFFSCSKDDSDNEHDLVGSWELQKELIYNTPQDTINGEVEIDTIDYEFGMVLNIFEGDSASVVDGISSTETFYIYNQAENLLYLDGLYYYHVDTVRSDEIILSREIWENDHIYYFSRLD